VIEKNFYPAFQDITNPVRRVSPSALPCGNCGSTERKLGAGKGPHTASLKCAACDRFIKWIGKSELAKIQNQGGQI
jgi:hypothetical protein